MLLTGRKRLTMDMNQESSEEKTVHALGERQTDISRRVEEKRGEAGR